MNVTDVSYFTKYAQANAHGAVHTLVGGVSNADWKTLLESWGMNSGDAQALGLQGFGIIKDLWRESLLSCPDSCSSDTSVVDCACTCPDFDTWDLKKIHELIAFRESNFAASSFTSSTGEYLGTKFMALACGLVPGYEAPFMGDAMNSGATADPSFWPVHPNVDRLFQWRRMKGMTGSESWPYGETSSSDFYWGAGDAEVCWGHQPDNTMICKNLGFINDERATDTYYTVKDLWEMNDPDMGHLPYAYPDFLWENCADEGYPADLMWEGTIADDDAVAANEGLAVEPAVKKTKAAKATKGKVAAAAPAPAAVKTTDASTTKGFHVTGRASDWEMYKVTLTLILKLALT
jgi:hypothetical protein